MKNITSLLFALFTSFSLLASDTVSLKQQVTFAVDQLLKLPNGASLSVILSEELKKDGKVLKGKHDVYFTLDPTSAFEVIVNEKKVSPGETVRFILNLSNSSHRIYLPIYPAYDGAYGDIQFSLHIPELSTSACPEGAEENEDGYCIKEDIVAGVYSCPETYTISALSCYLEDAVQIKSACPVGFALEGNICVIKDIKSLIVGCADGYTFETDKAYCSRTTYHPIAFDCPEDYTIQSDNTCKQEFSVEPYESCALGFVRKENVCERVLEKNAEECASGYQIIDGQCYKAQPHITECPTDYVLDGNICKFVERKESYSSCNDGYSLNEQGQCVERNFESLSGDACPHGTLRIGQQCFRLNEKVQQATPCINGYVFNGEYCVKEEVSEPIACASGWVMVDGTCRELTDFELICPSNYVAFENKCIKQDSIPLGQQCPSGYSFDDVNNQCYQVINIPAAKSCPQNFTLSGNICIRETSSNVSQCQSGYQLINNRCYELANIINVCPFGYEEINGTCTSVDIVEKTWRCPDAYMWNGTSCERLIEKDAAQSCANGYDSVNGRCVTKDSEQFQSCEDGFKLIGSECYKVSDQNLTCPDGYFYSESKDQCEKEIVVASVQRCPEGWSNKGTHCEILDSKVAMPVCPENYELSNEHCEFTVTKPVTDCLPHQIKNPDNTCSDYTHIEPTCPAGSNLINGACYSFETVAHSKCEDGYLFSNNTCHKILDESCPASYQMTQVGQHNICVKNEQIWNCPTGYEQINNKCVNSEGKTATYADFCPEGTVWQDDGSLTGVCSFASIKYESPKQFCESGFTKQKNYCFSVCPQGAQKQPDGTCASKDFIRTEATECITGIYQNGACWVDYPNLKGNKVFVCPEGYINSGFDDSLSANKRHGNSDECYKLISTPKTQICASELGFGQNICTSLNENLPLGTAKQCDENSILGKDGRCRKITDQYQQCDSIAAEVEGAQVLNKYFDEELGNCVVEYKYKNQPKYQCPEGFTAIYQHTSVLPPEFSTSLHFLGDKPELLEALKLTDKDKIIGPSQSQSFDQDMYNYLCIANDIAANNIYLGGVADQTFENIVSGNVNYGPAKNRNFIQDRAARLNGSYRQNGFFNPDYLLKNTTDNSSVRLLNGFNGEQQQEINLFGWSEVDELLKVYPIVGHENHMVYTTQLVLGKLPANTVNPKDYLANLNNGQISAVKLLPSCGSTTTEMIENLRLYNKDVYQALTSDGKLIKEFSSIKENSGVENCIVSVEINLNEEKCPDGFSQLSNGKCVAAEGDVELESCESVSEQVDTLGCPLGMELENGICFRRETIPADIDCGSGIYDEATNLCQLGTQSCLDGYQRNGDSCQKQLSCQEITGDENARFSASEGGCVVQQLIDDNLVDVVVPMTCPNQTDLFNIDNQTCSYESFEGTKEPIFSCQSGTLSGKECIIESSVMPQVQSELSVYEYDLAKQGCVEYKLKDLSWSDSYCPNGKQIKVINGQAICENQLSESSDVKPLVCPDGYSNNEQLGLCNKQITIPTGKGEQNSIFLDGKHVEANGDSSKLLCPQNSESVGSTCQTKKFLDVNPFEFTCPTAYVHNLSQDPNTLNYVCKLPATQPICDKGWETTDKPFTCKRLEVHELEYECESGYTLDGVQCLSVKKEPIDYLCPDTYSLTQDKLQCKRLFTEPVVKSCDEDSFPSGEQCISINEDNTAGICASGYTYDSASDLCRKVIEVAINYTCEAGWSLNFTMCEKYETTSRIESCPTDYFVNQQNKCQFNTEVSKVTKCPEGYALNGANCIAESPTQSAEICAIGSTNAKNGTTCESTAKSNVILSCEEGYELVGTQCQRLDIMLATHQCANGEQLSINEECESTQVTKAFISCPAGFTWSTDRNRCEIKETSFKEKCLPGYVDINGQCKRKDIYAYSCPVGFIPNGIGECLSIFKKSTKQVCPIGYRFNGNGKCYKTEFKNGVIECSADYYLKDGACRKKLYSDIQECPEGYLLIDNQCYLEDTVHFSCPEGYNLIGEQCFKPEQIDAALTCPEGYDFNPSTSKCEKPDSTGGILNCPTGYNYNEQTGLCEKPENVGATLVCPEGYNFNETTKKCEKPESQDAYINCPSGYSFNTAESKCEKHEELDAGRVCPEGYTFDEQTSKCKKPESLGAILNCPTGYTFNETLSKCEKQEITGATRHCPDGYLFDETTSKCQKPDSTGATLNCPTGYSYNPTTQLCERKESIDGTLNCPDGYTFDPARSKCVLKENVGATRHCPDGYVFDESTSKCQKPDSTGAILNCPAGYEFNATNSKCEKKESIAGTVNCPAGFTFDSTDESCKRIENIGADFICPEGYQLDSNIFKCVKEESKPTEKVCPDGFTYLVDSDTCMKREDIPSSMRCPTGYTYSEARGACQFNEYTEANRITCPYGYAYSEEHNKCLKETTKDATLKCPDGYLYDEVTDSCTKDEETPSDLYCPDGFTYDEARALCVKLEEIDSEYQCSAGYKYDSSTGKCFKSEYISKILHCPEGYTFDPNISKCTLKETTPTEKKCLDTYTFNPETQLCEKPEQRNAYKKCREGFSYSYSKQVCVKEEKGADPVITCPDEYTYNASTDWCEKVTQNTPKLKCNEGYTFNESSFACEKRERVDASSNCPLDFSFDEATKRCKKVEITELVPKCPIGYTFDVAISNCKKTEQKNANIQCPNGYSFDSSLSKCKKTESADASINCPNGFAFKSSSELCEKTDVKAKTVVCPSGFTFNSTLSKCTKTETQNAIVNCPAGYTFNNGTSKCEKIETQSTSVNCPSGYSFDSYLSKCKKTEYSNGTYQDQCEPTAKLVSGLCVYSTTAKRQCTETYEVARHDYTDVYSMVDIIVDSSNEYVCFYSWRERYDRAYNIIGHGQDVFFRTKASLTYTCPSGYSTNDNQTCTKQTSPTRILTCPTGYTKSGERCKRVVTVEESYVCPQGWTKTNSSCSRTLSQEESYSCLDGWSLSGASCSRTVTEEETYSCPAGYNEKTSSCEKVDKTEPEYYCASSDWVLADKTCSRTLNQEETYFCDAGWVLTGASCQRVLTEEESYVCPYGYTKENNTCQKSFSELPVYQCPSDEWNLSYNTCERVLQHDPIKYCLSGYYPPWVLNGDYCERVEWEAPNETCEAGFTKTYSGCVKTTIEQPFYSCPESDPAWTLNGTTCERTKTRAPYEICPDGSPSWIKNNGKCERILTEEEWYTCPFGTPPYLDHDATQCKRVIEEDALLVCPTGTPIWELVGTKCQREATAEPWHGCPEGNWTLENGVCKRKETTTKVYMCVFDTTDDGGSTGGDTGIGDGGGDLGGGDLGGGDLGGGDLGGGDLGGGDSFGSFSTLSALLNNETSSETVTLSSASTTTSTTTSSTESAEEEWELVGTKCIKVEEAEVQYRCPIEDKPPYWRLYNETTCIRTLEKEPTYYCPFGWDLNYAKTTCTKREFENPTPACPIDTPPWVQEGETCTRTLIEEPQPVCPIDDPAWTVDGDTCKREIIKEPWYTCPEGNPAWTLNGKNCERTVEAEEWYSCPAGSPSYFLDGTECKRTLEEDAWYVCPVDTPPWTLDGDNCTRTLEAEEWFTCPIDNPVWSLEGTECKRTLKAEAWYTCPAGDPSYTLDGTECKRTFEEEEWYVCPVDNPAWTLDDTDCKRTIYAEEWYTCPSGTPSYNLDGTECKRTLEQEEWYVCPVDNPAWKLEGTLCKRTLVAEEWYTCPVDVPEWQLVGTKCERILQESEWYVCPIANPSWNLEGKECYRTLKAEKWYTCPTADPSFTLDGSICKRTLQEEEWFVCPVATPPWQLEGQLCKRTLVEDAHKYCLSGYQFFDEYTCRETKVSEGIGICPIDYDLVNQKCEKEVLNPTVLSCKDSHILINGSCYKSSEHITTCPAGMTLVDEVCIKNESQPAIKACNDGYIMKNGRCEMLIELSASCATGTGTKWQNGFASCHDLTAAQFTCPQSFTLNQSGVCEKEVTIKATKQCPASFKMVNGQCVREEVYDQFHGCPSSHPQEYLFDRSKCTNGQDITAKVLKCENDQTPRNGKCIETYTTSSILFCDTDYQLIGENCWRKEHEYPAKDMHCPAGFDVRFGDVVECIKQTSNLSASICPQGYQVNIKSFDGVQYETCTKLDVQELTLECPADMILVGEQCKARRISDALVNCEANNNTYDDQYCVSASKTESVKSNYFYTCPTGYKANGENCYKVEKVNANNVCDSGLIHNQTDCASPERKNIVQNCLVGSSAYNSYLCLSDQQNIKAIECPTGFELTDAGICAKTQLDRATYQCPEGVLVGNECFKLNASAPSFVCPNEYTLKNGKCEKLLSEAITKECPSDYGSHSWQYCFKGEKESSASICPSGYKLSIERDRCEKVLQQNRVETCQDNREFNAKTGLCETLVEVQPDPNLWWVCPENYTFSSDEKLCIQIEESQLDLGYSCDNGYNYVMGRCERVATKSPVKSCPTGTISFGSGCKFTAKDRTVNNVRTCPTGFTFSNSVNLCVSEYTMSFVLSCSTDGAVYNPQTKLCESPKLIKQPVQLCEDGYFASSQHEKCIKEIKLPPAPSCSAGYVFYEPTMSCLDENIQEPFAVCPDGFTLTADRKHCERTLTSTPSIVCEKDFIFAGGVCKDNLPDDGAAICLPDYIYDHDKNICEKYEQIALTYTCDTGFTYDDDKKACIRVIVEEGVAWCPGDYEVSQDGTTCIKTTISEIVEQCPAGYILQADGMCLKELSVSPTVSCPVGFSLNAERKCEKMEEHNANISCPTNYVFDGEHCVFEDHKPVETCKAGYQLLTGGCYLTSYADYECPAGYNLTRENDELVCKLQRVLTSTVDCLVGYSDLSVPTCRNQDTAEDIGAQNLYCKPYVDHAGNYITGKFDSNIKKCVHVNTFDAQEYRKECPGDFIEFGEQLCRSVIADNSNVICANNYTFDSDTNYCVRTLKQSVVYSCFDGFSLNGEMCQKKIEVDVTAGECPANYEQVTEKLCVRTERIPATLACPIGYTRSSGSECIKREVYPPSL